MGLSVLAKGIPGVALPLGVIIISTIVFKTYKETFKSFLYGIPIFLLIALPWHIIMFKMYPDLFFDEYIYKHHILRFLGSIIINKNQPWYFYILTLIWGLIPHTFMLWGVKKIKLDKFLILNIIALCTIFLFFTLSKAKLVTYILPMYPFFAVIIAQIWFDYIRKDDKTIKYVLLTFSSILALGAVIFPFVAGYFLRDDLGNTCIMQILLLIFSYYLIKSIIKNERFNSFVFQSVFMAVLIGFITPIGYKIDYTFGQNDLMKFAKIAKEKHYTISTYRMGSKYSLLYYSKLSKIIFKKDDDTNWLQNELKKSNNFLIVKNKNIKDLPVKIKAKGVKYSIVEGL